MGIVVKSLCCVPQALVELELRPVGEVRACDIKAEIICLNASLLVVGYVPKYVPRFAVREVDFNIIGSVVVDVKA